MRIAIVDDQQMEIDRLLELINLWSKENCIETTCSTFLSGRRFLDSTPENSYEVVFMDIYMETLNGIDTALAFRKKDIHSLLVFLTTSSEHMPEAFPCHAFDYLIKPAGKPEVFHVLCEAARVLPRIGKYIHIFVEKKEHVLFMSDIQYVVADLNYSVITTKSGNYRCRISFSEISQKLSSEAYFLEINRGVLVNMDDILQIKDLSCTMKDTRVFPIRTRKRMSIEQSYIDYRFEKRRIAKERRKSI